MQMIAKMLMDHGLAIFVAAMFITAIVFIVYRITSLRFFPILTARKLKRVPLDGKTVRIPFFLRLKLAGLVSASEVDIVRKIIPEFVDKKKKVKNVKGEWVGYRQHLDWEEGSYEQKEVVVGEYLDFSRLAKIAREPNRLRQRMEGGKATETPNDAELEALLDQLADEFEACVGPDVSPLPDDAVTRAGIYRDHP
ncbi:MAG: hypothetical protein GY835_05155 [bacterium]|nr:hypothetical protein [bacterium]